MPDTIAPAFLEIAIDTRLSELDVVLCATGRYRILCGKSARLLRGGDRVALRDLNPDLEKGTVVVDQVRPSVGNAVHVLTLDGGAYLVRGSRLVLVTRDHT